MSAGTHLVSAGGSLVSMPTDSATSRERMEELIRLGNELVRVASKRTPGNHPDFNAIRDWTNFVHPRPDPSQKGLFQISLQDE